MVLFDTVEDISLLIGSSLFQIKIRIPNLFRYFQIGGEEDQEEGNEGVEDDTLSKSPNGSEGTLPREKKTKIHEHPLELTENVYDGLGFCCDHCFKFGCEAAYQCAACGFNLHTKCALDNS